MSEAQIISHKPKAKSFEFKEGTTGMVKGKIAEQIAEGNKLLTSRGGKGDPNVAFIDGQVKTVAETLACKLASDIVRDAKLRERKPLKEIGLAYLMEEAKKRVKGRATTEAKVNMEIGKLFNKEVGKLKLNWRWG